MNRNVITLSVLLAGSTLLGGCAASAGSPSTSLPTSSLSPTASATVTPAPSLSPSPAASASPSQTVSVTNKPSASPSATKSVDVPQQVLSKLKKKGAVLPRTIPLDKGQKLTASIAHNDTKGYKVYFYGAPKALPIGDPSLSPDGKIPVAASFTARGKDAKRDKDLFAKIDFSQWPAEQAVDLGHKIKGYPEGAAGSQYLSWKEGRWQLQIRSTTEDKIDNAAIARKIVDYLEKNALPAPHDNGKITIDYRPGGKKVEVGVYWQDGDVVYELATGRVPIDALTMAVSVK
ncbi:hypothetical protein SAMN05444162_2516 [Paenibacillaceae bacterium GAS479]|nr:hypothetical protein SAMN05444162_2516 [Paenibacillaceae bacterium GAS479]